jgi:hypothetical protein
VYEYKFDYFYKTKERKKRGRDEKFDFLLSPICATNGKDCSTDCGAMAQINYRKKFESIFHNFASFSHLYSEL